MHRNEDGTIRPMKRPRLIKNELMLEHKVIEALDAHGIEWERQVKTRAGKADVVTADTVYEVKLMLERHDLYKAFGQVTLYATALGKTRRVIVGYPVSGLDDLVAVIESMGVEINVVP